MLAFPDVYRTERRLSAIDLEREQSCSVEENAMSQPISRFDRIVARIKNNPVAAILIAAGTIVIAASTFSDATRNLLGLLKGQSPEAARLELSSRSMQYTRQAFVQSAKEGDAQVVKLFLAAGMDPNAKDDESNTALMYAIAEGRAEIIKALLKAKANVNEKNNGGGTALSWAAARGRRDTVALLLDNGADAEARNEAFVAAATNAHPDVMRDLLEKGARLNEVGSQALLRAAGSSTVGVADKDRSDTVAFLLDRGVDVNAKDREGWTALLLAADEPDRVSVMRTLLDRGADVNAKCNCSGYEHGGWTALMIASRNGSSEIVRMLIAKHADVNLKNNLGQTALALAANHGGADVVQTLLDAGADVNAPDISRQTPLMEAASEGNIDVVRILVQRGARVGDKDAEGKTAMQLADPEARDKIARLLSESKSK